MKTAPILCLLLLLTLHSRAQQPVQQGLDSLVSLLPSIRSDSEQIRVINAIATGYSSLNPAESIRYAERGMKLAQKIGWSKSEASMWINIGIARETQSDYAGAMEAYMASLRIAEARELRSQVGISLTNIGSIYYRQKELEKAESYQLRALTIAEEVGSKRMQNSVLGCLGNIYSDQKKYAKAAAVLQRALALSREVGDEFNITVHTQNLAIVYGQAKDYRRMLDYFRQATLRSEKSGDGQNLAYSYLNLGVAFLTIVKDSTRREAPGIMLKDNDSLLERAAFYLRKSMDVSRGLGDRAMLQAGMKSLGDVRSLQGRYHTALLLAQQQQIVRDSIFNAAASTRIARLEAQHEIDLKEKELTRSRGEAAHLKRQRLLWYSISGLVLATGIAGFFVYRLQRRRKEALLKADFDRRMADVEMQALRAQMNPHFIFNALSSINHHIAQNDPVTATNHLTKFAKLIRLILDSSASRTVTLAQETELLRLYLQMEAMRFGEGIDWKIDVDGKLDKESTRLPSMIIQPYVENAIWHGLLHRREGGKLRIRFTPQDADLKVVVEDDGVGRERAAEMKSKVSLKEKSHGMRITAERLRMSNLAHNTGSSVQIEDLKHIDGNAAGTRVTLLIQTPALV